MSRFQRFVRRLRTRILSLTHSSGDGNREDTFNVISYRQVNDCAIPIYYAIKRRKHRDLQRILQDPELDVNHSPDGVDQTPVHYACEEGNVEALELLVKHGGDVNVRDGERSTTPLIVAAIGGHVDVVRFLLDHGAEINRPCDQAILKVVLSELSMTSLSSEFEQGEMVDAYLLNTPLIQACREGHLEVVKELIERGCDINTQNANGNTALHVSCLGRTFYPYSTERSQYVPSTFFLKPNPAISKELLANGACADIINGYNHSALQRVFMVVSGEEESCLQLTGWRLSMEEKNEIIVNLFEVVTTLLEYGGNLTRCATEQLTEYHDFDTSSRLIQMVHFAKKFGLYRENYSVVQKTFLTSLDYGCTYTHDSLRELEEFLTSHVNGWLSELFTVVCTPQPLRLQCRIYIRRYLGTLHGTLSLEIAHRLALPPTLATYIIGRNEIH